MHRSWLTLLALSLALLVLFAPATLGDELNELDKQLDNVQQQIDQQKQAQQSTQQQFEKARQEEEKYRGSLNYYQYQYASIQEKLNATNQSIDEKIVQITQITTNIEQITADLQHRRELLNLTVRALYMQSQENGLGLFLAAESLAQASKTVVYRDAVIDEYKKQILELKTKIEDLKKQKRQLDELKIQLETEKAQLETEQAMLTSSIDQTRQNISVAQAEQQRLQQDLIGIENSLSELTQKQREILAAKAAAALASTTVGDEEIRRAAIEKAPPDDGRIYFSFWTYGYPHRVGMSQYGAYGRAKAGQSAEAILHAYYAGVAIVDYQAPETIQISQNAQAQLLNFEKEYLIGIGEMPSCWGAPENGGLEALKAQAVAARTYALSYTNNGESPICTDQNCQVYVGLSKVEGKCGEHWRQAVEETKGKVIVNSGKPIAAWYHSTAGGFTLSSKEVWGGTRSFAQGAKDFNDEGQPFDGPKYGNSPWYHKAWGNEPWLSSEEVADLFNAALLPEEFNDQLAAEDKGGINTSEIVAKLREQGIEPVTSLQALAIAGADGAQTTRVVALYGNGETKTAEVSAKRFRYVYNLRSPGTNAIWTTRFDVKTS